MTRVVLTDGSGKWFDDEKAVMFAEATRWNGHDHISRATGSQWDHEALWYTRSGNWILHTWSQYQGTLESHRAIGEGEAVRWLISQEHFDNIDELPDTVQNIVTAGIESAEL